MATLRLQVADATMQQHFQDTIAMAEFASLVEVPQVAYCRFMTLVARQRIDHSAPNHRVSQTLLRPATHLQSSQALHYDPLSG